MQVGTSVGSPALYAGFVVLILVLLAADLGVFRRGSREMTVREAAFWTLVWVLLAAVFDGFVWLFFGQESAAQFASGYLVEEALSVDNVFVISVVLTFFQVPKERQHRLLFWGILGALVLRGAFIGAGAAALQNIHFVIHLFGIVLVYTAYKLLTTDDEDDVDPSKNVLVRATKAVVPVDDSYDGDAFFVRKGGRWMATPLFLVLAAVEGTDILFAVDSIPAIFAVTQDPFIVYTSNIFAILGLRSLFFLVAAIIDKFHYLKTGVSVLLLFIGGKMLIADWVEVGSLATFAVILGVLGTAVGASLVRSWRLEGAGK